MDIVNLTKGVIYISLEKITESVSDSDIQAIRKRCVQIQKYEGILPSVEIKRAELNIVCGVPIKESSVVQIKNMPPEYEGIIYIVPLIVYLSLYKYRKDIYIVDEPFRTRNGVVVYSGCISRPVYSDDYSWIRKALLNILSEMSEDVDEYFSDKIIAIISEMESK